MSDAMTDNLSQSQNTIDYNNGMRCHKPDGCDCSLYGKAKQPCSWWWGSLKPVSGITKCTCGTRLMLEHKIGCPVRTRKECEQQRPATIELLGVDRAMATNEAKYAHGEPDIGADEIIDPGERTLCRECNTLYRTGERHACSRHWQDHAVKPSYPRGMGPIGDPEEVERLVKRGAKAVSPGGEHYRRKGAIEPIDLIESQELSFREGSIIKYVARWRQKDGVTDLLKARWFLDRLIAEAQAK